jgi:NAD(P)H-dependent FMN reductase
VGTTRPVNILGIPGSLRQASYSKAALKAAQELLPERATLEISGLDGIPPFNEDDERVPTRLAMKRGKSALIVRSSMDTA